MAFRNPDNTQQKKNHFDIMDNNSTPLTLPDGQFFFFIIIYYGKADCAIDSKAW